MKILKASKIFQHGKFIENHVILIYRDVIEDVIPCSELGYLTQISEVVDFGECSIIPGFIDTHTHMIGYGLDQHMNLSNFESFEEVKEYISETIKKHKAEVYIFTNFDESKWKRKTIPSKDDLDKISKKPIFLRRICGHIGVGNSSFIDLLGKTNQINPGKCDLMNGIFWEDIPLNIHSLFPPSREVLEDAFLEAQDTFIKNGITTIHEIGSTNNFRFFQHMMRHKKLKIRVRYYISNGVPEYFDKIGLESGFGNSFLKLQGLKFFADGSVGGESALFSFPYGIKKGQGLWLLPENALTIYKRASETNLQVATHSIGNLAIKRVLDIIESTKDYDLFRIEHFEFPDAEDVERASKMEVKISIQPNFALNWGTKGGMYQSKLGDFYINNNPLRILKDKGIKFAFGSDAMPPSPLYGIQTATEHPIPEYSLDLSEAIVRYTEWGSAFTNECNFLGKIEPGLAADFTVLEPGLKSVKATIIGGEIFEYG